MWSQKESQRAHVMLCYVMSYYVKISQVKSLQDKTRQDKTRQDKTRQDKTRQDKTRQDKTRQDKISSTAFEGKDIHACTYVPNIVSYCYSSYGCYRFSRDSRDIDFLEGEGRRPCARSRDPRIIQSVYENILQDISTYIERGGKGREVEERRGEMM